jgi:hypothetical protein
MVSKLFINLQDMDNVQLCGYAVMRSLNSHYLIEIGLNFNIKFYIKKYK